MKLLRDLTHHGSTEQKKSAGALSRRLISFGLRLKNLRRTLALFVAPKREKLSTRPPLPFCPLCLRREGKAIRAHEEDVARFYLGVKPASQRRYKPI